MKRSAIQFLLALLLLALVITLTAVTANAVGLRAGAVSVPRLDSELPPDLFDEDCDGGESCPGKNFIDMPPAGNWAHKAIDWALTRHVAAGTDDNVFSPNLGCTRAQVVTFLWRAAGRPDPGDAPCPFTDVSESSYSYNAIRWAFSQQIAFGVTDTAFEPGKTCTRAQIVSFVWRAAGSPECDAANCPFTDVKADAYYRQAVCWAVEHGVAYGTSENSFSPYDTCTRAQALAFLYRQAMNASN